jgi:hypothetical protein
MEEKDVEANSLSGCKGSFRDGAYNAELAEED